VIPLEFLDGEGYAVAGVLLGVLPEDVHGRAHVGEHDLLHPCAHDRPIELNGMSAQHES
jgi:hypothetical protein